LPFVVKAGFTDLLPIQAIDNARAGHFLHSCHQIKAWRGAEMNRLIDKNDAGRAVGIDRRSSIVTNRAAPLARLG
jgi:hypothetical protein